MEDDFLMNEDDINEDGRRPGLGDDDKVGGNTNTSLTKAGETGQRKTILRQDGEDGEVGTGCTRTNSSTTLEIASDDVPALGTTTDHADINQTNQFCQGATLVRSPGSECLAIRTGAEDDDKRGTGTDKEDEQAGEMLHPGDNPVRTDKDDVEKTTLLPSSAVSIAIGGGDSASNDDKGMSGMGGS